MARTLQQIREAARQRADMEDDGNFITDAEVNRYINQSIQTFYDFLIGEDSGSLFAVVSPTLLQIGDNAYQLPSDFYRLVSVSLRLNGGKFARATQADPQDYELLLTQEYNGVAYTRYFLHWNLEQDRFELFLFPAPNNTDDILMRYIKEAPYLAIDADPLPFPDAWIEWVEIDAAIKMLDKEESETQGLQNAQTKLEVRILDAINEINKTGIKKIRDVAYWEDRPRGDWTRFPLVNFD